MCEGKGSSHTLEVLGTRFSAALYFPGFATSFLSLAFSPPHKLPQWTGPLCGVPTPWQSQGAIQGGGVLGLLPWASGVQR